MSERSPQEDRHHQHHVPLLPIVLEHEAELPASHHHSANEFEEPDEVDELNDQDFDILPILSYEKEILKAIRESQITIIIGETGSGKTTQIPQIIMKYAREFLEKDDLSGNNNTNSHQFSKVEVKVEKESNRVVSQESDRKRDNRWDPPRESRRGNSRERRRDGSTDRDRERDRDGKSKRDSRERSLRDRNRERRRDDSRDRIRDTERDRDYDKRRRDSRDRRNRSTSRSRSRSRSVDRKDKFGRDIVPDNQGNHHKGEKETVKNSPPTIVVKEEPIDQKTQSQLFPKRKMMKMAITQPRRIAAISVAQRVQEEYEIMVKKKKSELRGTNTSMKMQDDENRDPTMENHLDLGGTIGYIVRFDDQTTDNTRIKFMTDGILIRECLSDPLLSSYSFIMLDEAHERSLNTDILFGLLKQVCVKRKDLKVIVTSATLDSEKFGKYFNNCPIIHIPGRLYPVDIYHSKTKQIMTLSGPANNSYIQSAVDIVLKIHHRPSSTKGDQGKDNDDDDGHILVFLTGSDEIEKACYLLNQALQEERSNNGLHRVPDKELIILPLYSALSNDDQVKVFQKPTILYDQWLQKQRKERGYTSHGGVTKYPRIIRKVVISTNIAETSITVPHVRYVIDAGFVKQKVFDPSRGLESLIVVPVSKISALQRAGRAGRTGPGHCYRLYSSECFDNFNDETIPEIQRTNLSNTILYLKAIGINNIIEFDFLDPPSTEQILQALIQLNTLKAIDNHGNITKLGRKMSSFPLDPHLSRMMIESGSKHCNCLDEIVIICAMLCVENVWYRPRSAAHHKSKPQQRGNSGRGGPNNNNNNKMSHYGPGGDGQDDYDSNRNQWTSLTPEEERCEIAHAGLRHDYGDLHTYLNIFNEFEQSNYTYDWCERHFINYRSMKTARKIRDALLLDAKKARLHELEFDIIPVGEKKDKEASLDRRISYAILAGYFMNAATRCVNDSVYKLLPLIDAKTKKNSSGSTNTEVRLVHMHPQSIFAVLKPSEFVVYQELVSSTKLFIKNVARVSGKVLEQHQQAWHYVDPRLLNGEEVDATSSSARKESNDGRDDLDADHASKRPRGEDSNAEGGSSAQPPSGSTTNKALSAVEQAKLRYLNRKSGKQ